MSKTKTDEFEPVRQLCREVIHLLDQGGAVAIDARIIANKVAEKIDPEHTSPIRMYLLGTDAIALIAREVLRCSHDLPEVTMDATPEQIDAFATQLQLRYSIRRKEWTAPQYVLRDLITQQEIRDQVLPMISKRLDAYRKHWDLLNAWNDERQDQGASPS